MVHFQESWFSVTDLHETPDKKRLFTVQMEARNGLGHKGKVVYLHSQHDYASRYAFFA